MFTVDKYYSHAFHQKYYNCWHFVMDVWKDLTGEELLEYTPTQKTAALSDFQELEAPTDPCIVLMTRAMCTPHVGVYYKRKVLHMHERKNVVYEALPIASAGFKVVRFFRKRNHAIAVDH